MPSSSTITVNNPDIWMKLFPFPNRESNKYSRGHALVMGGAVMTGAARLSARAAQRVGAGLVTLAAPSSALPIYASSLESVIVRPVDDIATWKSLLDDEKKTALLIGPGLGIGDLQKSFVRAALETRKPCVLDADALTNFASHPDELFLKLHPDCVLTPHEGEFARLFGHVISADKPRDERTKQAASLTGGVVLLKGANTLIASANGRIVVNNNAPPSLATAGSGDVLAGLILGLLAQNMPLFEATAAAAWLHGDIAQRFGPGLIAEDIISGIPDALKSLSQAIGIV